MPGDVKVVNMAAPLALTQARYCLFVPILLGVKSVQPLIVFICAKNHKLLVNIDPRLITALLAAVDQPA